MRPDQPFSGFSFSDFPSALRFASRLPALGVLAVAAGCAVSPEAGLPPVHKEPDRTLFASMDPGDVRKAETTTQWWLEGAPDPLSEARRLSRDDSRDVKSPAELLGRGVPVAETDVVRLALASNLDIRISDKERRAAVANVMARRGQVYDTVLSARVAESSQETPPDPNAAASPASPLAAALGLAPAQTEPVTAKTETRVGRTALTQRFFTGGTVELFYQESQTDIDQTSNDALERGAEAGLALTQPLLRGFGRTVTEQPILSARINQEISEEAFRNTLIAQVGDSLRAYYDLIFALENAAVQRISLQQALDLLDINISREKVGDLAVVDVEQARANAASRKEQYLVAIQRVYDQQDSLRRILNIGQSPDIGWDSALLPTAIPSYGPVSASEGEALQAAWANRPDWRQAALNIDLADLNETIARDALLPRLNLSATFADEGRARGGGEARDQTREGDFDSYELALEFSYPLLNREARHDHLRRRLERDSASLRLESLALNILTEIRARLRSLRTNRLRIDVTNEAVRAERVKYEAELKRYEVGLSTSFQLLQFLEDLSTAKVNNLQAIIDYQKSLVDLEQSKGTLLQRCGVTLEAGTLSAAPEFVLAAPAGSETLEGLGELPQADPAELPSREPYAPGDSSALEPFGEVLPELPPSPPAP